MNHKGMVFECSYLVLSMLQRTIVEHEGVEVLEKQIERAQSALLTHHH